MKTILLFESKSLDLYDLIFRVAHFEVVVKVEVLLGLKLQFPFNEPCFFIERAFS